MVNTDRVVIAAFRSDGEAEIARRLLVSEGIAAHVSERTDRFERRCADVFDDGFDVIVSETDADRATTFLRSLWPDDAPPAALPQERCASCGSPDIARIPRLRLFAIVAPLLLITGLYVGQRELFSLVIAIFGVILLVAGTRYCRACGERW